ncbi:transketolase C-terminal domain-containing protein [Thermodesulfobacteriota bacterium]
MSQKKFRILPGEFDRLELIAAKIRKYALENITRSGVGHPGGSLSIADILTVLYFARTQERDTDFGENILRYDPEDPLWPDRDRVILSKGHAAPALYATLAEAGFFSHDLLNIYRKIDSPLEGHPAMYRVFEENGKPVEHGTKGVDFTTGSLGHGLSAAAGMALHANVYGYDYLVYVLLGDGDLQEGMIWEAAMTIPNKKLNNVCAIIDYNRLQVDGCTDEINCLDPLDDKFRAFNWDVQTLDGHDLGALVDALANFKASRSHRKRPLAIIANTVKGKGVIEIENEYKYHALPLNMDEFNRAEKDFDRRIQQLESKIESEKQAITVKPPAKIKRRENDQDFRRILNQNPPPTYSASLATRLGYGSALSRLGEYEKIFVLNADLAGACGNTDFTEKYPENAVISSERRSINLGVQEANMMTMAAAIASCGKIPVVNSFGIFSTGRAWEMIRQDIAYPRLNVKIIGSHTGAALGEYGVSHQAIEDVGCMRVIPHLTIIEPSDALQADRLFEKALLFEGPLYFRVGRNPTPLFYSANNSYGISPVNDFQIGKGYTVKEGNDITLICSGPILHEALIVAQNVKESVQVIDMPTIRPIDEAIIEKAALGTGYICTVQDHYENCGLNEEVLKVIAARRLDVKFDFIALAGFAESGSQPDLYEKYGLSANRIIEKLGLTRKEAWQLE